MGKRITVIALTLIMLLIYLPAIAVNAKTVNKALLAEQVKAKAPNIKVYMTGTEMSPQAVTSASVEDITFAQEGDIKTFDETGEGLRYIILFDNSGSINKEQFDESKKQLKKWRKNLKNNDEMQLFTVGTLDISSDKVDVFERTVSATEADEVKNDNKKIDNIEYISDRNGKTILYRSLNQVLEEQSSQTSLDSLRTVIVLITDGEDDSDDVNGQDNDKDATLDNVISSAIPVYGILLNNTARNVNEEKIKFTKNKILNSDNGHGYYYNCSVDGDAETVKKAFKKLDKIFREETFVVNMSASTNKIIAGRNNLDISVNSQAIDPVILDYSDYERDTEAPMIVGNVNKEGKNTVSFSIEDSNGVNVSDSSELSHYTIETDGNSSEAKTWTLDQVNVTQNENAIFVTLTLKEQEFFNGDYILTVDGIRDESQDQNAMVRVKTTFTVEDGLDPGTEARKLFIQKYWWIALILLIVIIGVIVIVIAKKKSVKIIEKEVSPEELHQADTKLVRLTITDRSGAIKDVEWNVEGSLFVGRSDICNIYFDDDRLSKQHFVIEVTKMGCYIEDLESTNGTFVNGVKMTNRRLLLDGDVITAGREKIVFHVPKNEFVPGDLEEDEYDD